MPDTLPSETQGGQRSVKARADWTGRRQALPPRWPEEELPGLHVPPDDCILTE